MPHLANKEIAAILTEMSAFYEMEGVAFKPRAYERAAGAIASLSEEVTDIYQKGGLEALTKIDGVGKGIALHIEELLKTGTFKEYERLKKKTPVKVGELISVEGIGPKTIKTLWQKLKIRDLATLEKAAKAGKIRKLPGFGERSEQKVLKGIEFLRQSGGRFLLGFVYDDVKKFEEKIKKLAGVKKVQVAGSFRRMKETIGDIDILATASDAARAMEAFVKLPEVQHVYGKGETKSNVRLKWGTRPVRGRSRRGGTAGSDGIDADLRIVPEKSWGAALNYFTGSKQHNIELRELAIKKGWKLSEYGLFRHSMLREPKHRVSEEQIAGKTEEELYKKLGLRYIEPELREMTGEIEAARENELPDLIGYDDLRGDLQIQTNWTDGKHSIEEMAAAAQNLGLEYICITDHTKSLAMTGGHDERGLLKQMKYIDDLNHRLRTTNYKLSVLKGAEVNIMKDGSLDINDEVLAKLDVVGAAVHSYFDLPKEEQTKRVIRAMENPNVDIIFHLTGRLINKRKAIELDIDEIIAAAKKTGTVLEVDAFPDRLDIKDEFVRKCVEAGVKMSIDSDAHSADHFKFLNFGIAQARRGWATKADIINAWPVERMLGFLKKDKIVRTQ